MRLTLTQIAGPAPARGPERWILERGRRRIGRSPECDWQITDTGCRASKLHCTVVSDRDGFLLTDESANGTRVGGVLLLEGESARLQDGYRIEFAGFAFDVAVSGEHQRALEDPEGDLPLSADDVTVTSILADIAPGGSLATGILGPREADDWPPEKNRDDRSGTRSVEIGWSGPPEPGSLQPVLPEDWNESFDYGSRLEHAAATRAAIPLRTAAPPRDEKSEGPTEPKASPEAPAGIPPRNDIGSVSPADLSFARLESLVEQCEQASTALYDVFDLEPGPQEDRSAFPGTAREDRLAARLDRVITRQLLLASALDGLVRKTSQALEPRLIEAAVDAERWHPPWRAGRSCWETYCRIFEEDGTHLSVRELFRKTLRQALDEAGDGASRPDMPGSEMKANSRA